MSIQMSQLTQSLLAQAVTSAQTIFKSLDSPKRQYLSREFRCVSDPAQRAAYTDLILDLQQLLYSSKDPNKGGLAITALNTLKEIETKQNPQDAKTIKKIYKAALTAIFSITTASPTVRATSVQKYLSLMTFGRDLIMSAYCESQACLKTQTCLGKMESLNSTLTEDQQSEHLGNVKLKNKEFHCFSIPHFTPKTSNGIAFLCQWRRLLQKIEMRKETLKTIPEHIRNMEGHFRVSMITQEEMDKLKKLSTSSNDEVSAFLGKLIILLKYEKAVNDYSRARQVAAQVGNLVKTYELFSEMHVQFYLEYFPFCYEILESVIEHASAPSTYQIINAHHKKIVTTCKRWASDDRLYTFFYRSLHKELSLLKAEEKDKAAFTTAYCHPLYPSIIYPFNDFPPPEIFAEMISKETKKSRETTQPFVPKISTTPSKKKMHTRRTRHKRPTEKKIPETPSANPLSESSLKPPVSPPSQPSFLQTIFTTRDFPFKQAFYASRVLDKIKQLDALGEGEEIAEDLWTHAFPTQIDYFVGTCYSLRGTWNNPTTGAQDILYCIPGEVIFHGKTYRGFFTFCFDPQGTCYHRHFSQRSGDQFIDEVVNDKVWDKFNFPTLTQSSLTTQNLKPMVEEIDGSSLIIEPVFEVISLKENDLTYKIFKII
jgi:hypothetical protein